VKAKRALKIIKNDLPTNVTMPDTFFERMINIQHAGDLMIKSLIISGSIAQYLKSAESMKRMWDETNYGPVVDESLQKSIRMVLKLKDNAPNLIVGVRIRMGAK